MSFGENWQLHKRFSLDRCLIDGTSVSYNTTMIHLFLIKLYCSTVIRSAPQNSDFIELYSYDIANALPLSTAYKWGRQWLVNCHLGIGSQDIFNLKK